MKTLQEYVTEIRAEWTDVNSNAALYLDDMSKFAAVDCEDSVTAVARFILYARTWTGPRALEIKKDCTCGLPKPKFKAPQPLFWARQPSSNS